MVSKIINTLNGTCLLLTHREVVETDTCKQAQVLTHNNITIFKCTSTLMMSGKSLGLLL